MAQGARAPQEPLLVVTCWLNNDLFYGPLALARSLARTHRDTRTSTRAHLDRLDTEEVGGSWENEKKDEMGEEEEDGLQRRGRRLGGGATTDRRDVQCREELPLAMCACSRLLREARACVGLCGHVIEILAKVDALGLRFFCTLPFSSRLRSKQYSSDVFLNL
jgi:hypothetical protein